MIVLSLFDGISCAQHALSKITKDYIWHASEIDKEAIKVTNYHFIRTIQHGSVIDIQAFHELHSKKIDLLIGGSPCQGFSFAGKQLNFEDNRSKLFFEYVRILEMIRPKHFLLENVKMKKEYSDIITEKLKEIYPETQMIQFDSSKVSCQFRNRIYWTNFKWNHEVDNSEKTTLKHAFIRYGKEFYNYSSSGRGNGRVEGRFRNADKALTLTASGYSNRAKTFIEGNGMVVTDHEITLRKLFPNLDEIWFKRKNSIDYISGSRSYRDLFIHELGKIQGLPDSLFWDLEIPPSKAIQLIGNGMEVNTIEHILRSGLFT